MTEPDDHQQEALKREALAWLAQFSLREATRDDLAELRRWRDTSPAHAAALAGAGRLWRDLEAPVAALARSGSVSGPAGYAYRPSRRALLAGGAAAAAAAGVMVVRPPFDLWPSFAELAADHRTGTGEQQHLKVAEAVSVDLNTRTSVAMRPADQGGGLELIFGETAIAVDRAPRPFVVVAAEGRITTSSATFNLRRLGATVEATCIDGEVSVDCNGRALTLLAGQQVSYGAEGLGDIVGTDAAVVTAWRSGMLVFRNTPLVKVIDEVNRYRSGRIVLMNATLGQRLVTARFEISRLDTVMGQIGNVFKVPVKSLPGGLVLVG